MADRDPSQANPNGFKSLIHSPLFTGLLLFVLGQAVVFGLAVSSNFWKTNQLLDRMGKVESAQERMDKDGTNHSHWTDEQQGKDIAVLQSQMSHVVDDSAQFKVIQSEHRRLTKDVEGILDEEKHKK